MVTQQHSSTPAYNIGNFGIPGVSDVKRFLRNNSEEIDQELRRLEEDALPERTNRDSKRHSVNEILIQEPKKTEDILRDGRTRKIFGSQIPDEDEENDSGSTLERSPVSRLEYSVRSKKSQSEGTLRARSDSGDEFCILTKRTNGNYRKDRNRDFESEREKKNYELRIHPTIAHKILAVQKKISNLLDEIDFRLKNIPLPDGDRDLSRRQQRVQEFAIRFSRNYLYDLGRQIDDINRHLRAVSPEARFKPSRHGCSLHLQAIELKLISAHQLLLQALTAYCKHIPTSVIKGQPGKIKEILQIVIQLNFICQKINLTRDFFERGDIGPPPLGNDTENRCATILSKLRLSSDNESQIFNRTVQSTPVERFRNKSREKTDNCKDLEARLSMYKSNGRLEKGKNVRHRKQVRSCTRDKRLSEIDTTPQRYHLTTPEQAISSPTNNRISEEIPRDILKCTRPKIRLPLKEDEISTMMSILPTDSEAGSSVAISRNSPSTRSTHKGFSMLKEYPPQVSALKDRRESSGAVNEIVGSNNELEKKSEPMSAEQLSTLVPVIADLMNLVRNQNQNVEIRPASSDSMQILTEFLKHYRSSQNSEIPSKDVATKSPASFSTTRDTPEMSRNLQNSTRKANVQLICLPLQEEKSSEPEKRNLRDENDRVLKVDESSLLSLSKYREAYRDWSQTNPMYTNKSQNKPWDVVSWIADKLVDELIVDVSKEFEMCDVIQKLFELEFKEF
ncbi:uncharacterized protein [Venturia canescens]|nr:uncharacterized protein LOC122407404 isoform X2 [Venturia canescens]